MMYINGLIHLINKFIEKHIITIIYPKEFDTLFFVNICLYSLILFLSFCLILNIWDLYTLNSYVFEEEHYKQKWQTQNNMPRQLYRDNDTNNHNTNNNDNHSCYNSNSDDESDDDDDTRLM
jgi:hypothetical protein